MAARILGMDVEAGEQLATRMKNDSQQLVTIVTTLTTQLSAVEWHGSDANTFRSQWTSEFAPALKKVAEALSLTGHTLQQEAQNQRAASGQHTPAAH